MSVSEFKGFAGVVLRAEVAGDDSAPSVLLLHAAGQTKASWKGAADALVKAGRRVINLDLRGHGDSEWPGDKCYSLEAYVEDLRAVLAQVGSRPVIVATDFGGVVATIALGESGDSLASGLVLAEATPILDPENRVKAQESVRSGDCVVFDTACVDAVDMEDANSRMMAAAERVKVPVLFVRGERSELVSEKDTKEFVGLFSDHDLVEIPEAGRYVASERADIFNAELLGFLEEKAPLSAPEYIAGADPRILRDAMGCFATGITVVTAVTEDGCPVGLTANSFTSVSLDPPLLLVCIARTVGSLPVLENASHFGINILHMGQQSTSNAFAGRSHDRFSETDWFMGRFGVPLISNSLASIECSQHSIFDGGDHIILVGRVERASYDSRRDPLLYFGGKYRRLHFS